MDNTTMTLYKKQGRRYVPVVDTTGRDGLSNGAWVVIVHDGHTSLRQLQGSILAATKDPKALAAC
jgi:hypothetical protein